MVFSASSLKSVNNEGVMIDRNRQAVEKLARRRAGPCFLNIFNKTDGTMKNIALPGRRVIGTKGVAQCKYCIGFLLFLP
jgi:hypothetical protein